MGLRNSSSMIVPLAYPHNLEFGRQAGEARGFKGGRTMCLDESAYRRRTLREVKHLSCYVHDIF
jgi:hypothetical protein